jgi:hypothetical protein
VDTLACWLGHGPPQARVDTVQRATADPGDAGAGFSIR